MVNLIYLIITIVISSVSLISYLLLYGTIYIRYFEKNTHIYAYKVTNMTYTVLIILFYIIIFIGFLYIIRVINLGNFLDLKAIYTQAKVLYTIYITPLAIFDKLYLLVLCIILLMLFFLGINLFHKYVHKEFVKFYFYFPKVLLTNRYKYPSEYRYLCWYLEQLTGNTKLGSIIFNQPRYDIITNVLMYPIRKIYWYYIDLFYNPEINGLGAGHKLGKIYATVELLVKTSPFGVILYDCIFNDFIIIHFYYYMIIYIPIMLVRRVTSLSWDLESTLDDLLWAIYYENNETTKYIVTQKQKTFIELIIKRDLKMPVEFILDMPDFYLMLETKFTLSDIEQNIYKNAHGDTFRIVDNKIYEIVEDDLDNIYFQETSDYYLL